MKRFILLLIGTVAAMAAQSPMNTYMAKATNGALTRSDTSVVGCTNGGYTGSGPCVRQQAPTFTRQTTADSLKVTGRTVSNAVLGSGTRDTTWVFDNFDRPNGTLNGTPSANGPAWSLTGAAYLTARVRNGMFVSDSNVYAYLDYGKPIKRIAATYNFVPGSGANNDTLTMLTLIADQVNGGLSTMLHVIFGPNGWVATKRIAAGAFVEIGRSTYGSFIPSDSSEYPIAMDIGAGYVVITGGDGLSYKINDADIGTAIIPRWGAIQIIPNSAGRTGRFNSFSMGPSVAKTLRAEGWGAPLSAIASTGSGPLVRDTVPFFKVKGASAQLALDRNSTSGSASIAYLTNRTSKFVGGMAGCSSGAADWCLYSYKAGGEAFTVNDSTNAFRFYNNVTIKNPISSANLVLDRVGAGFSSNIYFNGNGASEWVQGTNQGLADGDMGWYTYGGGLVALNLNKTTGAATFVSTVSTTGVITPSVNVTAAAASGSGTMILGTASPCASGTMTWIPFKSQGVAGYIPWCHP